MTVGISNSERASKIDERIDAEDTVDTLDGVRVRLTATDSVDIGDGDGTLGVSETLEGVGVIDDDGDDGIVSDDGVLTSVIGVISVISCDENTEPLGRRNEVSNEVSGQLLMHFGEKVFRTVIPRNVRLAEAPSFGKAALYYDKDSRGALAYVEAAKEIAERGAAKEEST